MLDILWDEQSITELARVLQIAPNQRQEKRLLSHLNMTGLLLLEDRFPRHRKFYGRIICSRSNRVGEKEVQAFIGSQKYLPSRPCFIIAIGFTLNAQAFANRCGIALISFLEWAEYLLSGKMAPVGRGEKYNVTFLT